MSAANSSDELSAEIRSIGHDDAARTAFVEEQVKLAMELYRTNIQFYDSNLAVLLVCLETFDVVRGETIDIMCALTVLAILIQLDLSTIQMSQCTSYIQLCLSSVRTHDAASVAAKTFALSLRQRGTNTFARTQTDIVTEWIALTDQSQAMRSRRLCGLLVLCEVAVRSPMIMMPRLDDIFQHLWGTIGSSDEDMHNAAMQLLNLCTKLLCDRPANVRSEIFGNFMKQLRARMTSTSTAKRIVGFFAFKVIVPNTIRQCCAAPNVIDNLADKKVAHDKNLNHTSLSVAASNTSGSVTKTSLITTTTTTASVTSVSFEDLMALLDPTIASMNKHFKDTITTLSLYTDRANEKGASKVSSQTNSSRTSVTGSQANNVSGAASGVSTSETAARSTPPVPLPTSHGLIEDVASPLMDKQSMQLCSLLMQCLFVMCRFHTAKFVHQRHLHTTALIALASARAVCLRATAFKTLNDLISNVGRDVFAPYVHPTCAEIQRIFCESTTPSWEGLRCLSTICIFYSAAYVQAYINASIEHVLAWGICAQLIEFMRIIITTSNGSYRAQLEETMLDMISFTLCSMPFRNHQHYRQPPPSCVGMSSVLCPSFFASPWSCATNGDNGHHTTQSCAQHAAAHAENVQGAYGAVGQYALRRGEPTPLEVTVALEALPKFGLSDSELMADFLRHTVLPFVSHGSAPVREAAVNAIATLLLPPGDPRDLSASRRMCVSTVIAHMLAVAVSDTSSMIRLTVLKAFDDKFYPYLSEPSFLIRFYDALGDEHIQCRMAALETFAGMIPCDPAHILPSLREQMTSIMHFIKNAQNDNTVQDGLQLLTVLSKKAPQFIVNFSHGIVCALFPYFTQLTPASPLLLPFMDCCCAVFRAMAHFPHVELNLLPRVETVCVWLESMPVEESLRAARLACLRFLRAAVQPVMHGQLTYKALPRLFFLLSSMVRRSYDDRAVRLEAVRCLGVIGAVDPRVFVTLHLDHGAQKEMPMRLFKMTPSVYSCSTVLFHAILVQLRFKEQRSIVVRDNILRTSLQTIIRVVQHCPAARQAVVTYMRPLGRVIRDYSGGCMLASVLYDYTTLLRLLGSRVRNCAAEVFRVFDHVWQNIPEYRFLGVRMIGTLFHRDALLRMQFTTYDYLRALPMIFDAMSAERAPRELRYAVIGVVLQQDDTLQGCCEHVVTNLLHISTMTPPASSAELVHAVVITLRVICTKLYVDELTGSIVRTLLALLSRTLASMHQRDTCPGHRSNHSPSSNRAVGGLKLTRDETHPSSNAMSGTDVDRYLNSSVTTTTPTAPTSSNADFRAAGMSNAAGEYAEVGVHSSSSSDYPPVIDMRRGLRGSGGGSAHNAPASPAPAAPSRKICSSLPGNNSSSSCNYDDKDHNRSHSIHETLFAAVMSVFCVLIERMQGEFLRYARSIVTVLKTYGRANTEFVKLCGTLLEGRLCERAGAVVERECAETRALQRCCEGVIAQTLQQMDVHVSSSAGGSGEMMMMTTTCGLTMESSSNSSSSGCGGCGGSDAENNQVGHAATVGGGGGHATSHRRAPDGLLTGNTHPPNGLDESGLGCALSEAESSSGNNAAAAVSVANTAISSSAPPALLRECDTLPVDETCVLAAFKTRPVRREEWLKWIDHVALLLMQESPFEAFRCASRPMFMNVTTLVEKVPQLTRDVFFMTFHAMGKYASRTLRYAIMDFMQQTFREAMSLSSTIPNEVLVVLLSTVELMEHTAWGYTGSAKDISECAHKRSMLAKALFWSEITYRAHPETTVKSLISIYGELHMVDSAVGLLNTVDKEQRKGLLQSSLVTLGRFSEALRLTEEELRENGVTLVDAVGDSAAALSGGEETAAAAVDCRAMTGDAMQKSGVVGQQIECTGTSEVSKPDSHANQASSNSCAASGTTTATSIRSGSSRRIASAPKRHSLEMANKEDAVHCEARQQQQKPEQHVESSFASASDDLAGVNKSPDGHSPALILPLDHGQVHSTTASHPPPPTHLASSVSVIARPAALALSIATPITHAETSGMDGTVPAATLVGLLNASAIPPMCETRQEPSGEQVWSCQVRRLLCLSEMGEFTRVLQEWKRMYAEFDSRVMRSAAASAAVLAAAATPSYASFAASGLPVHLSKVPSMGTSAGANALSVARDGPVSTNRSNNSNNTAVSIHMTVPAVLSAVSTSSGANNSNTTATLVPTTTTAAAAATTSTTWNNTNENEVTSSSYAKTLMEEDGNILYYVSRYAADACIHLQDFDSLRNVLPWVPHNTVQYHIACAALNMVTGDLTAARAAVKEGRALLLDELADLLQESYRHAYQSLVVAQQLTELDEMIHARASLAKFKSNELVQSVRRVWGQRIAIMEPSVAVWKVVLSTRSLLIPPPQDVEMRLRFVKLCRHERAVQLERFSLDQLLGCSCPSYGQLTHPDANPFVVMQYIKYLSATHAFGSRSPCAQEADFIRTVIRQHEGRGDGDRDGVLARAYARLGSIVPTLSESRVCFYAATQHDPSWPVGWRKWANVNVALMSCEGEDVSGQHDDISGGLTSPQQKLAGDEKDRRSSNNSNDGDDNTTTIDQDKHVVYESIKQNADQARALEQDRKMSAFTNAVEGYVQSILLGAVESTIMQDVLRLLTLWSQHGDNEHGRRVLRKRVFGIPSRVWKLIVPQLIARLDTGSDESCAIIADIVQGVAYDYPHILLYPLNLCVLSNSLRRRRWASAILDKLQARDERLVQQGRCIIHELIRIAAILPEQWHEKLEAAANAFFGRQSVEDMKHILLPLHASVDATPETIMDAQFILTHRATLSAARDWLRSYMSTRNLADVHAAWQLYHKVFKEIEDLLKSSDTLCMEYCSPVLFEARDLAIGIPTKHTGEEGVLKIAYFDNDIRVIASKQRPKRISVVTTQGRQHRFLLKGREDLRLDERVMQLFQLVNVLMMSDSRSSGNDGFQIQHYSVMPLSESVGMIGWVDGCDTLHKVVQDYRAHFQVPPELEMRLLGQIITLDNVKAYDCLTVMSKVEVIEFLADMTSGHDIRRAMVIAAPTTEVWVRRRNRYTASLSHMSMVGYILGLGDRHPNNIMLQENSGRVVHIDFSDCFEVAIMRDRFPEKVPFRLTRMLRQALDMSGVDGSYRSCAEQCMTVLRQNSDSVLALLEAFLQDPLISWRLVNRPGQQPASSNDRQQIEEQIKINKQQNKQRRMTPRALSGSSSDAFDKDESLVFSVTKHLAGEEVDLVQQGILMFKRLSMKLRGKDFGTSDGSATLDVPAQVGRLIVEATDVINIAQSWSGWYPYW